MEAWNKGLTKETDERVAGYTQRQVETKKRRFAEGKLKVWNDGLTKKKDHRVAWSEERKQERRELYNIPEFKGHQRQKALEHYENHPETKETIRLTRVGTKESERTKRKER